MGRSVGFFFFYYYLFYLGLVKQILLEKKGTFDKTSDNSDLFSYSDQDNEVASSMSDLSDFEYLCYLVVFIVTW